MKQSVASVQHLMDLMVRLSYRGFLLVFGFNHKGHVRFCDFHMPCKDIHDFSLFSNILPYGI